MITQFINPSKNNSISKRVFANEVTTNSNTQGLNSLKAAFESISTELQTQIKSESNSIKADLIQQVENTENWLKLASKSKEDLKELKDNNEKCHHIATDFNSKIEEKFSATTLKIEKVDAELSALSTSNIILSGEDTIKDLAKRLTSLEENISAEN